MKNPEKLILQKIIYSDIFNWPLTEKELGITSKKFLNKKIIETKNGYYFLAGRSFLVERRLKREKWAQKKIKIATKSARILKIIPTIILVGISGGLAVGNVSQNDDIDFFIVCQNGTLWTTRFFSTLILDMFFLRRKPNKKSFKDKICLNMFVDETGFSQLKKEKDVFTQHELNQLKILWKRKNSPKNKFNFLEKSLKKLQIKYMKNKITTEKIEDHKLMFHPNDAKSWVLKKYFEKFEKYKLI